MSKEMLINTVAGQECRIAIVSDGGLEELYVERTSTASRVGNIYKARVTNVESSIQAAFVDTGLGKNGFLHISDINPTYFPKNKRTVENVGQKRSHYYRPPIQECLRRGQEVVVQMIKEGIGTKGPTMTTYLSIPGRLLVMMPGMSRLGVSRKVDDEDARDKARSALSELTLPPDMGFIVRTAGVDRSKRDLQRDLNYLLRLWKVVKQQMKHAPTPSEIYQESDLVTRTIRDVYSAEIERIICDSAPVARQVEQFLNVAVPRSKHSVELYTGKDGLYYEVGLETEIEKIHSRRVELPMGGSLIFDQTEALVAIDVNSGRFRQHSDAETTALNINLQAAREIARQLRLRDMGGVIVIDFIDMREEKNRRQLEKTLKEGMKPDRAKTKVLRTNPFGLIALTRQRLGPSLKQSYFNICDSCDGLGVVQSEESLSLRIVRNIQRASADDNVAHIEVIVPPEVAHFLLNRQRLLISQLEAETGKTIVVRADSEVGSGNEEMRCTNSRGAPVAWEHRGVAKAAKSPLTTIPIADVPVSVERAPAETQAKSQGGIQTPVSARGGAYAEIDFDEIEVSDGQQDDGNDAELDRAINATAQADQRDGEQGEAPVGEVKKKRRGRRGGRKHRRRREAAAEAAQAQGDQQADQQADQSDQPDRTDRTDRTEPKAQQAEAQPEAAKPTDAQAAETDENAPPKKKRRRRRRRKSHATTQDGAPQAEVAPKEGSVETRPAESRPQARPVEREQSAPKPQARSVEQTKPEPAPQVRPVEQTKPEPAPQVRPVEQTKPEPVPQVRPVEQTQTEPEPQDKPSDEAEAKPAPKKAKRTRRKKVVAKKTVKRTEKDKPDASPKTKAAGKDAGEKAELATNAAEEEPAKPKARKKATRRRRTKKAVASDKTPAEKGADTEPNPATDKKAEAQD